jgi:hypothetical protein
MFHVFNRNIDESIRFLGQIANCLEKDKKFSDQISLREYGVDNFVDIEHYNKALEMLHKAAALLKKQKEEILRYEKQEEQDETDKASKAKKRK